LRETTGLKKNYDFAICDTLENVLRRGKPERGHASSYGRPRVTAVNRFGIRVFRVRDKRPGNDEWIRNIVFGVETEIPGGVFDVRIYVRRFYSRVTDNWFSISRPRNFTALNSARSRVYEERTSNTQYRPQYEVKERVVQTFTVISKTFGVRQ